VAAAPLAFVPSFPATPEPFLALGFAGLFLAPFAGAADFVCLFVTVAVFFAAALTAVALLPFAGAALAVGLTLVLLVPFSPFFALDLGAGVLTEVLMAFSVFAGADFASLGLATLALAGLVDVVFVVVVTGALTIPGLGTALVLVVGTATAVILGLAAELMEVSVLTALVVLFGAGREVVPGVFGFSALLTGSDFLAVAALISFGFVALEVIFVVVVALAPEFFGFSIFDTADAAVVVEVIGLGVFGLIALGSTFVEGSFDLAVDFGFTASIFDIFASDFGAVNFLAEGAVLVPADFFELVVATVRGEGALAFDFSFDFAATDVAFVVEIFGIPEIFGLDNFDVAGAEAITI